mgnify:CR=1 FL=1
MPTLWLSNTLWNSSAQWISTETGVTIYEVVFSIDSNNLPITATTFTKMIYVNGVESNKTLYLTSIDPLTGAYVASFFADEATTYQYSIKSSATQAIFLSDIFHVVTTADNSFTVYIEPPPSSL